MSRTRRGRRSATSRAMLRAGIDLDRGQAPNRGDHFGVIGNIQPAAGLQARFLVDGGEGREIEPERNDMMLRVARPMP